MENKRFDVVGIGNAIVDIIIEVPEATITDLDLAKGSMNLIDLERSSLLRNLSDTRVVTAGGSVANSMVGVASYGGSAFFVGKVAQDELGVAFGSDIKNSGVEFSSQTLDEVSDIPDQDMTTGSSVILVTPDSQRTMNTCLGICSYLSVADIDLKIIEDCKILFCEGYIWDRPMAKDAIRMAIAVATDVNSKISLTLSDTFCVERHRDDFLELVESSIDILFANEEELKALYECDLEQAMELVESKVDLVCVTLGAAGSILLSEGKRIPIPAVLSGSVVDTTGAGDQYAAGVLYALSAGLELEQAGYLGSLAAGEVISHMGPRPEVSLAELSAVS